MNILGFSNNKANSLTVKNYYGYNYDEFNMAPHSHMSAELMYCSSGESEVYLYLTENNKEYKKFRLKKGQFILIFSGLKHRLYVSKDKPCKIYNLEFSPAVGNFDISTAITQESEMFEIFNLPQGYILGSDSVDMKSTIKKLLDELSTSYLESKDFYIQMLIAQLLIQIYRSFSNAQSDSKHFISKTMEYIKENYSHEITVTAIAEFVGLNVNYLERLIKSTTGKTILAHITDFRLTQAKSLILNTNLSLTDIGFHCGYGSRQSFYENFKKSEGISPSDYKKKIASEKYLNYKQTPYEKV